MDWTIIITLILQLISSIFGIDLSGILGGIVKPTAASNVAIYCYEPNWQTPATVSGNVFKGKIQVVCELETAGNGDIATLEARLAALNTADGAISYGAAQTVAYGGRLDGHARDVAFKTAKANIKGRAELVSDGESELRRSFLSTGKDAQATSSYLREISQTVEVSAMMMQGKYRVVITTGASVAKPLLVSASKFLDVLKKDLQNRAVTDAPKLVEGLSSSL